LPRRRRNHDDQIDDEMSDYTKMEERLWAVCLQTGEALKIPTHDGDDQLIACFWCAASKVMHSMF